MKRSLTDNTNTLNSNLKSIVRVEFHPENLFMGKYVSLLLDFRVIYQKKWNLVFIIMFSFMYNHL